MRDRVTVLQYYKGFWSLYALGAGISFLPPLIHVLLGNSDTTADLFYPPLGDLQRVAVALTLGFLILTTFVVFVCCRASQGIHFLAPILLSACVFAGAAGLFDFYVQFVRIIPIETRNTSVPLTIGYERTAFALQNFKDESDWSMLHDRGPREESVQLLWTRHSIWMARFWLWICYTLTLSCILAVVSLGVYQHVSEAGRGEPRSRPRTTGRLAQFGRKTARHRPRWRQ